jgi:hypothetical protein
MKISRLKFFSQIIFFIFLFVGCQNAPVEEGQNFLPGVFDGERAYRDVATQVDFGPRYPGSAGHALIREWLVSSLEEAGWQASILEDSYKGETIYNIEACRGLVETRSEAYLLLGAHYDTRLYADNDPDLAQRAQPVPGANDGGSGVAVLLELARVLPEDLAVPLCLVFFDAEDGGRIDGWEWAVGSRLYVEQLAVYPQAVVIVDMVGDADQHIPIEQNSDQALAAEIWNVAAQLGVDTFSLEPGPRLLDDHTPFLQQGIPAVDIIDFSYPYWHTVEDTVDKVSAESLKNVGDVLLAWLLGE